MLARDPQILKIVLQISQELTKPSNLRQLHQQPDQDHPKESRPEGCCALSVHRSAVERDHRNPPEIGQKDNAELAAEPDDLEEC